MRFRVVGLLSISLFMGFSAWAGGTSYYHSVNGAPLQWGVNEDRKAEIHYIVDAGGLGRLSHDQAVELLQAAMDIWEAVANVEFIFDGITDVDVNEANYREYAVVDETICTDGSTSSSVENDLQFNRISLIVFDDSSESEIINDADGISGTGNAYGLTNITCIDGTNADPEFITSAQIIFNGTMMDGTNSNFDDITVNAYLGVMVHELGHSLGLDHSDTNGTLVKLLKSGEIGEEYLDFIPTMAQLDPKDYGDFMATLHPDDVAAIQALYPLDDSPTTTVTGTAIDADGTDFRGAQLELRDIEDPLCEVYSFISGKQCTPLYLNGGDILSSLSGTRCGDESTNTGDFYLRAIPEGTYTLSAQEVIDDYKGGVIHPWSTEFPIDEIVGAAEFYNSGDAASEDPLSMSTITVEDSEISNLNIVLSSNTADGVENLLDLSVFSSSPFTDSLTVAATSRCQPNTVDYAALIGVEEIVGTTEGDDDGSDDTDSATAGGCGLVGVW